MDVVVQSKPKPRIDRASRRAQRTRQRLLDGAAALFRENGIDSTTIEQITERADVGKGTFYRHFEDRDAVVLALIERLLDQIIEHLQRVGSPFQDMPAAVHYLVLEHVKFFSACVEDFRILFSARLVSLMQRDNLSTPEAIHARYVATVARVLASPAAEPLAGDRVRRWICAMAGFVSAMLAFAEIGLTAEENVAPMRQAFVSASCRFLTEVSP